MFRVGFGTDSHRFESQSSGKPLTLGGITIPNHVGLQGESDADVILHALFNALSQSLAHRSLGYYVKTLPELKEVVVSKEYLKLPLEWLGEGGYQIANLGVTLECKTPRIEPYSDEIRQSIADLINIDLSQVGVNATSGEDLTPFGRGEGIQAFVVVLISKI